jgi:hypothetical protein
MENKQTDENGKPLTYWGGRDNEEILIPVIPNVECRDGKEIGVWMEGWLNGYKEAQCQYEVTSSVRELHQYNLGLEDGYNKAKETLYTKEQVMDAIRMARQINYLNQDYEIIVSLKLK